ncbi:MAG: hypothetical protein V4773_03515 [Verrucomicrobiota bacterium]
MTSENGDHGWAMPRIALVAVLAAGFLAFLPSLLGGFLADDFTYIARFSRLKISEWPALFTKEWSGGVWGFPLRELRPFAALSFIIDSRLYGGNPVGYRVTNMLLHLSAVGLVALMTWRYSRGSLFAAVSAGLIFALHPAHVEPVTWITGRVDLLGTVAALVFIVCCERYSESGRVAFAVTGLIAIFVGLFSKEFCMLAPLIVLSKWLMLDFSAGATAWKRRGIVLGGSIVLFGVYAFCRTKAFGAEAAGANAWNDINAWHRHASHLSWLVPILPLNGLEEWASPPAVATAKRIWIASVGIGLVALLAVRIARSWTWACVLFFSVIWYLFTLVPLMVVGYFTPRHLYFPSVGLAVSLGMLCTMPRVRYLVLCASIIPLAMSHVLVLRPWAKAGSISRDVLGRVHAALAPGHGSYVLITAVPEKFETALLMAWSMPAGASPPFMDLPPSSKIIVRPGNYVRPERWFDELQPAVVLKESTEGFVLYVDEKGAVISRRLDLRGVRFASESLDAAIGRGLSPESYTEWVKMLATTTQ